MPQQLRVSFDSLHPLHCRSLCLRQGEAPEESWPTVQVHTWSPCSACSSVPWFVPFIAHPCTVGWDIALDVLGWPQTLRCCSGRPRVTRYRHWKPLPDFGLLQACSVNFGNILQLLIFSPQAPDSANFAGKLCEGARALDGLWSGYDLLCIYCLELKLPGPANLQRSYLFLPQHQSPRPSGRSDFPGYPFGSLAHRSTATLP